MEQFFTVLSLLRILTGELSFGLPPKSITDYEEEPIYIYLGIIILIMFIVIAIKKIINRRKKEINS